jgi:hypothetical protein
VHDLPSSARIYVIAVMVTAVALVCAAPLRIDSWLAVVIFAGLFLICDSLPVAAGANTRFSLTVTQPVAIAAFVVLASGVQGTTVNPSEGSPDLLTNVVTLAITFVTTAAWVFWVDRLAKRRKLATLGGMLAPPLAPELAAAPATVNNAGPTPV